MSQRVFLSASSLLLPNLDRQGMESKLATPFSFKREEAILPKVSFNLADLGVTKKSPFYPNRKDSKSMRPDVLIALEGIGQLLAKSDLSAEQLLDTPLFVSCGIYLDQIKEQMNQMISAYCEHMDSSKAEQNQALFKVTHPLFALKSLTNAGLSFAAQYFGVKGCNTSFGQTSTSTFDGIFHGYHLIKTGEASKVVVGAANGAGDYAAIPFTNFENEQGIAYESMGASFLLLESEESMRSRSRPLEFEIVGAKQIPMVPNLFNKEEEKVYDAIHLDKEVEGILFTGGRNESNFHAEQEAYNDFAGEKFSWFPFVGTLGVAAPAINVSTACDWMKIRQIHHVMCLDRDPYGRETWIKIDRAKEVR